MSKRPPEMFEKDELGQKWATLDEAMEAIRSLRVKLFRERANLWRCRAYKARALGWTRHEIERMFKRSARFSRVADAIERGAR